MRSGLITMQSPRRASTRDREPDVHADRESHGRSTSRSGARLRYIAPSGPSLPGSAFEATMWILLAAATLAQAGSGPDGARAEQPPPARPVVIEQRGAGKVSYWLESSLKRVFPATPPGTAVPGLLVARNGRASFQACVRNDRVRPLDLKCSVAGADDLRPRVRWV